jgi:hypothetical protein
MIHILSVLFSWPDGIVVGNLIASALWAVPAVAHLDRLAKRHHREHMELLRRHRAADSQGHEDARGDAQGVRPEKG